MKTMRLRLKLIGITLFSIIIMAFQCGREEDDEWQNISRADSPVLTVISDNAQVQINDTIMFSARARAIGFNSATGDSCIGQPNNIYFTICRMQLPDSIGRNTIGGANDFNYFTTKGSMHSGSDTQGYKRRIFYCELDSSKLYYDFKFGFIPKIPGVYAFRPGIKFTNQDLHHALYINYGNPNTNSFYIPSGEQTLCFVPIDSLIYFVEVLP